MGKMPTDSLGKSSELKLHCFCLFDAYSMPKDMCSALKYKLMIIFKIMIIAPLKMLKAIEL